MSESQQPPASRVEGRAPTLYDALLNSYSGQVEAILTKIQDTGFRQFVQRDLLLAENVHRILTYAEGKMALTLEDGEGHSVSWDVPAQSLNGKKVLFMVETIPSALADAPAYFTRRYRGYPMLLNRVHERMEFGCKAFTHFVFGANGLWCNIGFIALWEQDLLPALLPRSCFTQAEIERYGL